MKKTLAALIGVAFVASAASVLAETSMVTPKNPSEKAVYEACKNKGLVGTLLDKCFTDEVQKGASNKPLTTTTGSATNPGNPTNPGATPTTTTTK